MAEEGGASDARSGTWRRTLPPMLCAAAASLVLLGGTFLDGALPEMAVALLLLALAGATALFWPVLDMRAPSRPMAELIALVGCDGAGKSTQSHDLLALLARDRPVRICYLGLGSGELGNRIKALPLIGPAVERQLARKAAQTRTAGQKIPGLPTAIVVYAFSLARLRRFRRMLALRRAGVTVITDRYPQIEVPGFYDGPGLSAARAGGRLVAALARKEREIYAWMASIRPDVVIRLNVDARTAFERKPDHGYDLLQRKVEATSSLRFNGAPIVDLDSRQPYAVVSAAVARTAQRLLAGTAAAA